jgi:trimeric autotransporter adhesin
MKTKILSGLICCIGIFSANAQTITAPSGQSLIITNAVNVTGGSINIPVDSAFKIGTKAILSNKGTKNLFVGEGAGIVTTGADNLFLGSGTGFTNSTGFANSFLGSDAGRANTTGSGNLFLGTQAGRNNIGGSNNSFIGIYSGYSNISGTGNVMLGESSGYGNTTGANNIMLGSFSGRNNVGGSNNSFIGSYAGYSNTSGDGNVMIGDASGFGNTTGYNNIMMGKSSGRLNTVGFNNSFIGVFAGYNNTSGAGNVMLGLSSGLNNTTGNDNIFIGNNAGSTNTTGTNNTYLGNLANGTAALTNATAIGAGAAATASNTVVLGQNATTITGQGLPVTATGASGLRFASLNSGNTETVTGNTSKVLSVDNLGNVILVKLASSIVNAVGDKPVAESIVSQVNEMNTKVHELDKKVIEVASKKNTWIETEGFLHNNSTNGVVIDGVGFNGNALVVKGKMLSNEVNVELEGADKWPDYVFQPSYKRMSLDEVEKFITVNKHLPNVPSAAEMAITGNNLGKTDVKLLEKVEELTLYLLEMKKANDAQSAELKALKMQVNSLKKNRK